MKKTKKPTQVRWLFFKLDPGGDLLSHTKYHAVPSAQKSLTTEFGMGSGVTSSLRPPRIEVSILKTEHSTAKTQNT